MLCFIFSKYLQSTFETPNYLNFLFKCSSFKLVKKKTELNFWALSFANSLNLNELCNFCQKPTQNPHRLFNFVNVLS